MPLAAMLALRWAVVLRRRLEGVDVALGAQAGQEHADDADVRPDVDHDGVGGSRRRSSAARSRW